MKIEDVKTNLGKTVHYKNKFRLIDHDFKFNAYILQATKNGYSHEAELQDLKAKGSVFRVPLEDVQEIAIHQ